MKAKFVNEALGDILKAKSGPEVEKAWEEFWENIEENLEDLRSVDSAGVDLEDRTITVSGEWSIDSYDLKDVGMNFYGDYDIERAFYVSFELDIDVDAGTITAESSVEHKDIHGWEYTYNTTKSFSSPTNIVQAVEDVITEIGGSLEYNNEATSSAWEYLGGGRDDEDENEDDDDFDENDYSEFVKNLNEKTGIEFTWDKDETWFLWGFSEKGYDISIYSDNNYYEWEAWVRHENFQNTGKSKGLTAYTGKLDDKMINAISEYIKNN